MNIRSAGGRFLPGISGNPKGKPKGTSLQALIRRKTSLAHLFMNSAEKDWPEIVEQLFSLAKQGDLKAINIILENGLIKTQSNMDMGEDAATDIHKMTKDDVISYMQTIRQERDELLPVILKLENKGKK